MTVIFKREQHIRPSSKDISSGRGRLLLWASGRQAAVLGAYVVIFLALFWGIRGGVGQYWDWSFPYFQGQIHNIFTNQDSAWVAAKGGSPLGYASDYFFRFFMAAFGFFRPETF